MAMIKRLLSFAVIAIHLSGCAMSPVPAVTEAQRECMGRVGVVSLTRAPQSSLDVGARGRLAGASEGAAAGAVQGLAELFRSSGAGYYGATIILLPIAAVGGAIYGAMAGAAQAVPEDKAEEMEACLKAVLGEVGEQDKFRTEIIKAVARSGIQGVSEIPSCRSGVMAKDADDRWCPDAEVETVLEVGLLSVALIGRGGEDPQLVLFVQAVARLVDANTNTELYCSRFFTHLTGAKRFSEWNSDGARSLKESYERACQSLARSIVEEVFLIVRSN
jgi:hypothetical protein